MTDRKDNHDDVMDALRTVKAPYQSLDMVRAGMVRGIARDGGTLKLEIDYRIPPETVRSGFEDQVRAALTGRFPDVRDIVFSSAIEIDGLVSKQKDDALPQVKNTIAVASGKGGVGKSTVAVNIAIALARAGGRVGLLDADIYGPSIPMMMGISEQPKAYRENGKTWMLPCDNYGVRVMSIGFLIDKDDAMVWRGPMASSALRQLVTDVDWGAIDYLIFDMPPGTGDIQLTLSQMLPLNGAIIVSTPQDVALADARKGVKMFQQVNVPVLGIVENMSYYICSHCGSRENIFRSGGGASAASELGIPFLGEIPLVGDICAGGDSGVPVTVSDPAGSIAGIYTDLALTMAGSVAERLMTAAAAPVIDLGLPGGAQ